MEATALFTKDMLDVHAGIDKQIFHPAMQKVRSKEAKYLVLEALEKALLKEIARLTPEDDEFDAKVKVLQENVSAWAR
jgi:hypothetical protein